MNHITAKEARVNYTSSRFGVYEPYVDQIFDDIESESKRGKDFLLFDSKKYEKLYGLNINLKLIPYLEELGYKIEYYKDKFTIKW